MKKVVYTCITGGYDVLMNPILQDNDWEFICYSDEPLPEYSKWQWREIPKEENKILQQRRIKIYNEEILNEYDISMWVDGSIFLKSDVQKFVDKYHKGDFTILKHPAWDCIYREGVACIDTNRDSRDTIVAQLERMDADGMPRNWGQVQSGVMIRNNTDKVRTLCRQWMEQIEQGSIRDQLSFTYICWKYGYDYNAITSRILFDEFLLRKHTK